MEAHQSTIERLEARVLFDDSPHVGDIVPDATFNNSGVAEQLLPGASFEEDGGLFFVASLPGGKVLTAGETDDGNSRVVRLNHDGSFDTTYGGGDGTAGPLTNLQANRALLQSDGKMLLFAIDTAPDPESALSTATMSVERLNADGSVDTSFGTEGIATASYPAYLENGAFDVSCALAPDGKIVVTTQAALETGKQNNTDAPNVRGIIEIARFTSAGQLDGTFGHAGQTTVDPMPGAPDYIFPTMTSMGVQSSGKIVFSGNMGGSGFVGRINADGTGDNTFTTPTGGTTLIPGLFYPAGFTDVRALLVLSDDKILIGGNAGFGAIERLNINGSADTSFGTAGVARRPAEGTSDVQFTAIDLEIDSAGNIDALMLFNNSGLFVDRFTPTGQATNAQNGGDLFTSINLENPHDMALVNDDTFLFAFAPESVGRFAPLPVQQLTPDGTLSVVVNNGDNNTLTLAAGSGGNIDLTLNGTTTHYAAADVKSFDYTGSAGDDSVTVSIDLPDTAFVTLDEGTNHLNLANFGHATIDGGDGHDTLHAGNGDLFLQSDLSSPRSLSDEIHVGNGKHEIFGGAGDDTIVAGDGDATVRGQDGDDSIQTGAGNDDIEGGDGNDTIDAGAGNDNVTGENGDDQLIGGAGDDILVGDSGGGFDNRWNNILEGGDGNDALIGDDGHDTERGGAGRDTLWGYGNSDLLIGGGGKDKIAGMGGADRIYGGNGDDQLDGGSGNDRITAGAGNDKLFAGNGTNTIDGGEGEDFALARSDVDQILNIETIAQG